MVENLRISWVDGDPWKMKKGELHCLVKVSYLVLVETSFEGD